MTRKKALLATLKNDLDSLNTQLATATRNVQNLPAEIATLRATIERGGQAERNMAMKSVRAAIPTINSTSTAIFGNGFSEVNGFKFSEYYYNKLWNNGR